MPYLFTNVPLLSDEIELNFPATPDEPASAPPGLSEALGVAPEYIGKTTFDYLVEVDSDVDSFLQLAQAVTV